MWSSLRIKLIGLLIIIIPWSYALAVEFVYRVDARPPDIIFRDGFSSHGTNRDFQAHLSGYSCGGGIRNTYYIATSSDFDMTYRVARVYFTHSFPPPQRMYRYRIRADNTFYSLRPSFDYLRQRGISFSLYERVLLTTQNEYVALGNIPTTNIEEAVEMTYDRDTDQIHDGAGTSNSQYIRVSTESNPNVIPDLPVPYVSVRQRISAFGALISACFSGQSILNEDENSYPSVIRFYDARPVINEMINIKP